MTSWSKDDGTIDVTSAFQGFTAPLNEIYDDIHSRGWTVSKIQIKDGQYVAEGKSIHGDKLEASGRTDSTAAANLLVKILRHNFIRSSSIKEKIGAWDHSFENQLQEIAQAYAEAPIYEPKAAPAWMDLAQDFTRRAQVIRQQLTVEYTDDPTPYMTADEMREDVQKKHIEVSRGFAHHPVWNEQQMLDYRLVVDVLGHTIGGADWGWHGTCLAYSVLAPMVGELSQKALFTELIGQTAFGSVYRQWGAQKIAFLDELIEKAQEDENGPGHVGVHPSQSLVPGMIPRIGAVQHKLWWKPGEWGRGFVTSDNTIYTWPETEMDHEQRARAIDDPNASDPTRCFMIDPNGGFTMGDSVDDNQLAMMEEYIAQATGLKADAHESWYSQSNWRELDPRGRTSAILQRTQDPNADWESGVNPLPDNAYLWQRKDGVDPLDSQNVMDGLRPLDPGISKMHPELAKQAVVNALRGSLLGSRRNAKSHAIHYQTLHSLPAHVDEPMAYWDAFEQARENWNQASGYAPHAHKQYWAEEKMFQQWIKALNPHMDDGAVQRMAKQELVHMLTDEEARLIAQDPSEELTTEQLEHEAYEQLRKRLKAMTKPSVDQKVDFGDHHLFHEAARQASPIRPRNLSDYISENGPWAYRNERTPEIRDAILNHPSGLLPWDHPENTTGSIYEDDYLEPRPGHTYFGTQPTYRNPSFHAPGFDHGVWEKMMRDKGLVIDLRKLDPDRFSPDEDWWSRQRYNAVPNLPEPHPSEPSLGQQAEATGLGEDPDHTYQALRDNAIAYRGNVPSDAMVSYTDWEAQHGPLPDLRTATYHADMYPPYLSSHLRPLAQISRNAEALSQAAREDLLNHKGRGHHFRATALSLGIPEIGPRQASNAWLHLAPQTSQLGVIDPHLMETMGHSYLDDMSPRDYFKYERELQAGRDAAGYNHVPLGAFSSGLHDLKVGGPGWHPDRTVLKPISPTPHQTIDWTSTQPTYPEFGDPYWWNSTQQARDGVATDFDRNVAVENSRSQVPFQKTAMAERSGFPELDQAIEEFMQTEFTSPYTTVNDLNEYRDPEAAWGNCEIVAKALAGFLKQRGFKAYTTSDELVRFPGYDDAQAAAGDFMYPEHAVVEVYGLYGPNNVNTVTIDFAASQYGFTEFPKIHGGRLGSKIASTVLAPWLVDPVTGERLSGPPGGSLMAHIKQTLGHPDVHSVWAQDYEVGKGPASHP